MDGHVAMRNIMLWSGYFILSIFIATWVMNLLKDALDKDADIDSPIATFRDRYKYFARHALVFIVFVLGFVIALMGLTYGIFRLIERNDIFMKYIWEGAETRSIPLILASTIGMLIIYLLYFGMVPSYLLNISYTDSVSDKEELTLAQKFMLHLSLMMVFFFYILIALFICHNFMSPMQPKGFIFYLLFMIMASFLFVIYTSYENRRQKRSFILVVLLFPAVCYYLAQRFIS